VANAPQLLAKVPEVDLMIVERRVDPGEENTILMRVIGWILSCDRTVSRDHEWMNVPGT
jgi:hypothetical protein